MGLDVRRGRVGYVLELRRRHTLFRQVLLLRIVLEDVVDLPLLQRVLVRQEIGLGLLRIQLRRPSRSVVRRLDLLHLLLCKYLLLIQLLEQVEQRGPVRLVQHFIRLVVLGLDQRKRLHELLELLADIDAVLLQVRVDVRQFVLLPLLRLAHELVDCLDQREQVLLLVLPQHRLPLLALPLLLLDRLLSDVLLRLVLLRFPSQLVRTVLVVGLRLVVLMLR